MHQQECEGVSFTMFCPDVATIFKSIHDSSSNGRFSSRSEYISSSLFFISAMLHDVCRSQTPTRTRNPLFRHRLHVSILLIK